MALHFVAGELCRGGQVDCCAGAAVSKLHGLADALGWVLALVSSAAADRTHLDSTRALWSLPTIARVAARPLETSKRLAWTAYNGQPFVYEAIPTNETVKPNPGGGIVRSSGQMAQEQLPVEVWTRCLDSLGSDGWEPVTVSPLSGDVRVEQIYANDRERDRLAPQAAISKAGYRALLTTPSVAADERGTGERRRQPTRERADDIERRSKRQQAEC